MDQPFFATAPPTDIAIVRLRTGLGDLLCGVPALRALRARLPEARVTLVTYPEMEDVVARMAPWVDDLLAFPGHPGIPERTPRLGAWDAWVAEARDRRFDLALQSYGANSAANAVTAAMGAARTGGFFLPGEWSADLDVSIPYPQHLHEVDRHLALMDHLGAPACDAGALELPIRPQEERAHLALLARTRLGPGHYAVLHPGATSPSRRWPAERFAAVGDALHARGLDVAVTGVPGEEELTRAVVAAMDAPAFDLCGATSLGGAAALCRDAALVLCNDTGTGHIAGAIGTPSVTLFLSGDPGRFGPRGRGEAGRVARVQVECNPCHHLRCPIDHRCALRLDVQHVLSEADQALAAAPTLALAG